ncbi:MAG: VWA domain-containing protein [Vicinamibacterales bacterium]
MRILSITLAFALIGAGVPQDRQLPTFRTGIDLVQVDVVVVDKNGNPVTGLKDADFALMDRRKPQLIATFDEITHRRSDPITKIDPPPGVMLDVASNQTAQSERLVILVIDDLHIWKERTEKAKAIARKVLTDLGTRSSMAVLFTSQEHSTQVTTDQSRLRAAVDTLKGRQSWRRPHQARDTQTGARIDAGDSAESALAKIQNSQDTKVQDFFDNLTQYKTLRDAARLLGQADSRRKAFVLVSEGVGKDLTGLFGAMAPPGEALAGGTAYASGDIAALASHGSNPYHDEALIEMMEALRRANVATYAIDPRGKVDSADLIRECFPAPAPAPPPSTADDPCSNDMAEWHSVVRLSQHGLEIASAASGGFAVTNTDDFTSGIMRIVEDLDHYYLLGFYPAETKGKGYRPLDVRVAGHPDWTLRFRRGYMAGSAPAAPKKGDPMLALSSGLLPKTDLPLRLGAVVLPGADKSRVVLALEVSASRRLLESADGKFRDRLKYEVLVVDQKKSRVRSVMGLEGELTLSRSGRADNPPDRLDYQVGETIELAPGRYELRVSAVSTKLGQGGSVYLSLEVPDLREAPLAVGGLAIGRAGGTPIPVAPPSSSAARGGVRINMPALPFAPWLDRAFAPSDDLRVYFEGLAVRPHGLTAAIEVLDEAGKVVRSPSPSFFAGERVRVQGVVSLAGLPPGAYVLRGTLADGVHSTSTRTAFSVR